MASMLGLFQDQNLIAHSNGASALGKGDAFKTQKGGLGGRKPLGVLSNSGKPKPLGDLLNSNGASALGKGDAFKTQKKGGLGGRKPLGDLSNSGKPDLSQALKKQPLKEINYDASNKKGLSKASDKVQTRSRRALSDISNSQDPQVQKKQNTKLSVLAEELSCPGSIAEEGFLHNHDECIKAQKAQTLAMDMDQFLMAFGLHNNSSKKLSFSSAPLLPSKSEPDSPPKYFDLEEMPEHQYPWLSDKFHHCKSPKSPNSYADSPLIWEDCDFELMKTP